MPPQLLELISSAFDKKNQDYINISEWKEKETATQLSKILDVNIKKFKHKELKNVIEPLLPSEYNFRKKRSIYIFRKSTLDIIYSYAVKHPTFTLNSNCIQSSIQ